MRKILAALIIAAVCFGPTAVLLGIGLVMNPGAQASCLPGTSLIVGPIPDSLDVTTKNGERFTLNRKQLTHAATIITVGGQTDGIDTRGEIGRASCRERGGISEGAGAAEGKKAGR